MLGPDSNAFAAPAVCNWRQMQGSPTCAQVQKTILGDRWCYGADWCCCCLCQVSVQFFNNYYLDRADQILSCKNIAICWIKFDSLINQSYIFTGTVQMPGTGLNPMPHGPTILWPLSIRKTTHTGSSPWTSSTGPLLILVTSCLGRYVLCRYLLNINFFYI